MCFLPVSLFIWIIFPVLRHISHLQVFSHFRDRSPCAACDFVVKGHCKTWARYCIRFAVFYEKTSGYLFTSFVRGDLLPRWRQKEHKMMRPWFLLVMMRGKNEPLLNQNGNILVLFSTKCYLRNLGKQVTLSKMFLTISINFTAFHGEEIFPAIIKVWKMSKIIVGSRLTRWISVVGKVSPR